MTTRTFFDPSVKTREPRLLGAVVFALISLMAGSVALADERTGEIAVNGRGEVQLVPDQAALQLTLSRSGPEVGSLRESLDEMVAALLKQLAGLQIYERDIASTRINIQPVYRYDQKLQKRVSEGYEVSRTVSLTLRDLELLEKVIAGATDLGVNNISPPVLSSSEREQAYRDALALAVLQARERAEVIAAAANVTLADVISVNAGDAPNYPVPVARVALASDAEGSRYQPGEMTVVASVSVVFELAD